MTAPAGTLNHPLALSAAPLSAATIEGGAIEQPDDPGFDQYELVHLERKRR